MNLKYIGDALDHWKGSIIESLSKAKVLRNFAVDPMASDLRLWAPHDHEVFAKLLRIKKSQIIQHISTLDDRTQYFGEISHTGDLFLDPDTGVATGRVSDRRSYVFPSEIEGLLSMQSDRVLSIYQHVRAKRVTDRLDEVIATLTNECGGFEWCTYESGTVGMLFVSRESARATGIAKQFQRTLGRHAAGRIRCSCLTISS